MSFRLVRRLDGVMDASVDSIIAAFGGTTKAAAALGLAESTVSTWRARRFIPLRHWGDVISAAPAGSGITTHLLANIAAKKFSGATPVECAR
jgi:hypothetical protein